MKTKIFLILLTNMACYYTYGLVTFLDKIAIPSTTDPYCASTKIVVIKWTATEVNNNFYQVRRSTEENGNTWVTVSGNKWMWYMCKP